MTAYTTLGLMSGSSLDGLDLCCAKFTNIGNDGPWEYEILQAETVSYSADWKERLATAEHLSGVELARLNVEYGHYLGKAAQDFITEHGLDVDLVASHGHTIIHQPDIGFTCQIGDGETMVSYLKVPAVCNFRNKDVALGGQGAPLVPGGETFLFPEYDFCLNLGGICNISDGSKGFDISPCNMMLNHISMIYDPSMEFDDGGKIASRGQVLPEVLAKMNSLPFYRQPPPKSLGKEWFEETLKPVLDFDKYACEDLMRTCVEHICQQISNTVSGLLDLKMRDRKRMLITGGGALNEFLVSRLRVVMEESELNTQIVATDAITVNFKEALVFAFLGLRAVLGLTNVRKEVTGSSMDNVSGSIHLPPYNPQHHALLKLTQML